MQFQHACGSRKQIVLYSPCQGVVCPACHLLLLQVLNLIKAGIKALTNSATGGTTDTLYMLLTGSDITQGSSGSSFCKQYCGWHTYYPQTGGVNVKYLWAGKLPLSVPKAPFGWLITV